MFEGSSPYSEVALSGLEMETSPWIFLAVLWYETLGCHFDQEKRSRSFIWSADDLWKDSRCAGCLGGVLYADEDGSFIYTCILEGDIG